MGCIKDSKCTARRSFCPVVAYQKAAVSVPVEVTPNVDAGDISIKCMCCPEVRPGRRYCHENNSCSFTVIQKICIEIPLEFSVDVETGTPLIDCMAVGVNSCCD